MELRTLHPPQAAQLCGLLLPRAHRGAHRRAREPAFAPGALTQKLPVRETPRRDRHRDATKLQSPRPAYSPQTLHLTWSGTRCSYGRHDRKHGHPLKPLHVLRQQMVTCPRA